LADGGRRTFAIIAHPDAGKTTLTEKLLLSGGAIREAGEVRARGDRRRARSDWMKIEQQRGISVTSSVMTFEALGCTFNLLDTPGHQDFSEDTYRTLTAVDSAVMVIDAAKGIEAQTLKLFEVCRLRDVPIITFINKVDREGLSPFALMDEIAEKLALDVVPKVWPVGMGGLFRGLFDFDSNRLTLVDKEGSREVQTGGLDDPLLDTLLPADELARFREDAMIAAEASPDFDLAKYRAGAMTPVYFGSALREHGIAYLLEALAKMAPPPRMQPAVPEPILPDDPRTTGFVFKVQANMDPNHRDRVAFMRVCSGTLKRGMKLTQQRTGKAVAIHNPIFFFASDRELVEEALPGDIVGIPNHGTLRVGDALYEGAPVRFTGLPDFAPEILRRAKLDDPMKSKQMRKALEDLGEEGVARVFRPMLGSAWVVGVVGALQLDVLQSRILAEYGVAVTFEPCGFDAARWLSCDDAAELRRMVDGMRSQMAEDANGDVVYLARDSWEMARVMREWPNIRFGTTRERH